MNALNWRVMVASLIALTGCGSDNNSNNPPPANPHYEKQVAIQGVAPTANYSFDLSLVSGTKYYFTDRNSAAVQVIDIPTLANSAKVQGTGQDAFAGLATAGNSKSGPDGVNAVGDLLYAGDVNSVKIIDPTRNAVLKTVKVSATGVRADEGCFDQDHHLYMISSPEEPTPFSTFIDTNTQSVVAQVTFTDNKGKASAGLEQCRYDSVNDAFFVNNDGTSDNPHGELVKLPGPAIRAVKAGGTVNYTTLDGVGIYAEGNCDPTGLALGPGSELAVGCREGTTGWPLLVLIFDRKTGAPIAQPNAGGGDQIEYDPTSNRYYNASSRWTASGNAPTNGACSAASPCTPVLTIIDAASHGVVARLPTGNNAHSVAVDPATGYIFMPVSSGSTPAGCGTCAANGFNDAGVAVFKTK